MQKNTQLVYVLERFVSEFWQLARVGDKLESLITNKQGVLENAKHEFIQGQGENWFDFEGAWGWKNTGHFEQFFKQFIIYNKNMGWHQSSVDN